MTASKPHFLPKAPPPNTTDILFLETVFWHMNSGVHSQHPWFSALQPLTSSPKLEFPIPISCPSSNLWNLTFSKDLLPSDKLLCVTFCTGYSCKLYVKKRKTRKAEQKQLNPPIHYIIIYCLLAKFRFWHIKPTIKKREGDTGLWFMPFYTGFSFIINTDSLEIIYILIILLKNYVYEGVCVGYVSMSALAHRGQKRALYPLESWCATWYGCWEPWEPFLQTLKAISILKSLAYKNNTLSWSKIRQE